MSSIKDIFKGIFDRNLSSLSDRMEAYENVESKNLEPKTPVIIQLEGRSFGTYTKDFKKPYDSTIINAMKYTTTKLCNEIQNVKFAYSESDKITLCLIDYEKKNTQQWFNGNIQKIVSLSSSLATYYFNDYMETHYWSKHHNEKKPALFYGKVFNLPRHEVVNNFIYNQQQGIKNSILELASSHYGKDKLHRKTTAQMLSMLIDKKINWDEYETNKKLGFCVTKEYYIINPAEIDPTDSKKRFEWVVDDKIPLFSKDKSYIDIPVMIGEIENKFNLIKHE